ncbi:MULTISPECIES: DUF4397 domain-containing protein [unclassified Shewanella]|uniref:DUF4397 domain-containing protein n=1 Tax=unclassified Shewanella TaxID=196818 RepID=UPI001BBDC5CF|nr:MULTISPECIES: DUF4397 domain-containing protein [unclassified Shewanella]GIU05769.1 hypothetical protein TUM4444_02650 [Shewanella sp. MBTL60-112-B1]GIU25838.1 hypothetical protein TUM4445_04470 [Shewanella sp. MBTL60-112-B2]
MKLSTPFCRSISIVTLSVLGLAACSSDDDDNTITIPPLVEISESEIRVIHAGSDAPLVDVLANGSSFVDDVNYAMSSGLTTVPSGNYAVAVDAQLPDGTTTTVLTADLDAEADFEYTAVALGNVADDSLMLKLIANPEQDIAANYARVQVLHASPAVGLVDIYVTEPGADISMMEPTLSANYMDASPQLEIPAADYQIRITAAGDKTAVYDSGTVPLADEEDYFISAIPNTGSGMSPVALLVALPEGQLLLNDTSSGSDIRVVHAVADAPAVDVFLDGSTTAAVTNLMFKGIAGYINIPEGEHTATVAASADNNIVVIDKAPFELELGDSYSILAVGSLADNDIEPWVIMENTRKVATEAKLTVSHAAYSAPNVDVYLTATDDIANATPALTDVPFKASSGSLSVPADDYIVSVTVTGTKTVAIGPLPISLENGGIYGVAAVDSTTSGAFDVILLDDFVAMK